VNNKAILLRSVSTLATAAASTALGVHGAQAQVVPAGTDGYYYSVTGGFALSKSEQFLTGLSDKAGTSGGSGFSGSGSSYVSTNSGYTYDWWSSYSSSYTSGLDEFKGLFASVSFGKQIGNNLDIRGSLSMTGVKASGYGYAASGYSSFHEYGYTSGGSSYSGVSAESGFSVVEAEGTYSRSLLAADFEVGYTPTLGNNLNVRLFAGLRALKFTQKFEGYMSGSSYYASAYYDEVNSGSSWQSGFYASRSSFSFEGVVEATFTGIGPRVGVQGSTRFEGTNFGLSGSLATSVLFGKQTVKTSGYSQYYSQWVSGYESGSGGSSNGSTFSGSSFSSAGSSSYTYSGNKTVLDLQASAGVDYYLNDNTVLTVGYQAEQLLEIAGDDLGPAANIDSLTHGAFVKLSGSF
jgi:hypothetical protein